MTREIPREHFAELVKIVSEEVRPMGFTENVDISNGGTCEVNLFNVDDGGYVGIVLITDSGTFSMRYTTGCRPFGKAGDVRGTNSGNADEAGDAALS